MPPVDLNYLAILIAAVVSMILGAIWYSPAGLGKQWVTLMGWSESTMQEKKKEATKGYVISFIASLVMAYVLAHFIDYVQATTITGGLQAGFWIWLGFIATTMLGSVLWEGKHWQLYGINAGFQLISVALMGAILATMG